MCENLSEISQLISYKKKNIYKTPLAKSCQLRSSKLKVISRVIYHRKHLAFRPVQTSFRLPGRDIARSRCLVLRVISGVIIYFRALSFCQNEARRGN